MNREPYQIIIMRPTGGKAIMTLRSLWVRLFVALAVALLVTLLAVSISVYYLYGTCNEHQLLIDRQAAEIKDLNISIARKDEKIISLKKKMSTTIRHQPTAPLTSFSELPELHPPTVEVTEMMLKEKSTCG